MVSEMTPEATFSTPPSRRWVLVMAVVGTCSVSLTLWRVLATTYHSLQLDLDVYLMGARNLTNGRLYTQGLPFAPHLPFTYPTFSALVFTPLAALPHELAQLGWAVLNVTALAGIIALSLRVVRPGIDGRRLALWTAVLLFPAFCMEPVWLTFNYGQINLVLTLMVIADLTTQPTIKGRTWPRGILIGIAAAIKLIPLIFVAYLLVTRQLSAARNAVISFLACTALAFAFAPSTAWSYWTTYVNDASRVGGIFFISNQSLRGGLDRLTHRQVPGGIATAVGLVVVVFGLFVAYRAYTSSTPFLGLLVTADTGLLASPITWAHHMVWVVPIVIWLLWGDDRPRFGTPIAAAASILFWTGLIWRAPWGGTNELHENAWQFVIGNSFLIAALGFMIGVALMLWQRQRHTERRVAAAR